MNVNTTVTLNTTGLDNEMKYMPEKVDAAVRGTAFQVQALAAVNSPRDTGANASSIYTKTSQGASGKPGDLGDILPEVKLCEAVVGPSMSYSAFLEYGTSRMAARPYLLPAAEQAPALFAANIKAVMK